MRPEPITVTIRRSPGDAVFVSIEHKLERGNAPVHSGDRQESILSSRHMNLRAWCCTSGPFGFSIGNIQSYPHWGVHRLILESKWKRFNHTGVECHNHCPCLLSESLSIFS